MIYGSLNQGHTDIVWEELVILPLQKVNGKRLSVSLYWKIPGSNGTCKKVVLFFRTKYSKRRFELHLLKLTFDTTVDSR